MPKPLELDLLTYFRVGLDDEATELLLGLSAMTGQSPAKTLARLVRDILIEDAQEHGDRPLSVSGPRSAGGAIH